MIEKTFVMIKPEHLHISEDIFKILDNHGTRLKTAKVNSIPKEIVKEQYKHHKEKYFYEYLLTSLINKPVIIAIYQGEDIIKKLIDIIGPTDPTEAPQHTIRGKFSNDSREKAGIEKRWIQNVIHRSDSIEEAEREINIWKEYF